jgi:hypothetical protein
MAPANAHSSLAVAGPTNSLAIEDVHAERRDNRAEPAFQSRRSRSGRPARGWPRAWRSWSWCRGTSRFRHLEDQPIWRQSVSLLTRLGSRQTFSASCWAARLTVTLKPCPSRPNADPRTAGRRLPGAPGPDRNHPGLFGERDELVRADGAGSDAATERAPRRPSGRPTGVDDRLVEDPPSHLVEALRGSALGA